MFKTGKVTKRELILTALFALVYIAVLTEKFVEKVYANFQNLEKEIVLNEKKLVYLKTVLNKSGDINAEYDRFFSGKIGVKDSDKLMQDINNIARRLNMNIINIKPSLVKDEDKYKLFSIKIESQDDVATLAWFLDAITEQQKNIGLERVQIKAQGKEELPRISLALDAVTFKD